MLGTYFIVAVGSVAVVPRVKGLFALFHVSLVSIILLHLLLWVSLHLDPLSHSYVVYRGRTDIVRQTYFLYPIEVRLEFDFY